MRNELLREGTNRLFREIRVFASEKSGSVALVFAFVLIIATVLTGGAVDFGRWLNAKSQTQSALDASVVAVIRVLQTSGGNESAAVAAAQEHFMQMKSHIAENHTPQFSVQSDGMRLHGVVRAAVRTAFLGLAQVPELPIGLTSEAQLFACGDSQVKNEISVMLDVTGSMQGEKLSDMKDAAKELIKLVSCSDEANMNSRIALVPFSEAVNVGQIGVEVTANKSFPGNVNGGGGGNNSNEANFVDKWGQNKTYYLAPECVSERTNKERYTDAAPSGQDKIGRVYTFDGNCRPSNEIVPLTKNVELLNNAIDGLVAGGATAGHLGTAWSWYTLSPNWGNRFPPTSRPADYGDTNVKKIAILMTGGTYNTQYCMGVNDNVIDCSAENGSSAEQAAQLCTNMKALGITVYSVGFKIAGNISATEVLSNCASGPEYFFNVDDGDQLKLAYREIAMQISTIRMKM